MVNAAQKVVAKARRVAAHLLEVSEDDLEFASGSFSVSDTLLTPQLNFNTTADNQQVRVDLMNTSAPILETTADNSGANIPGVLQNLFVTAPGTRK